MRNVPRIFLSDTECLKDIAHIARQKARIMLQTSLPPTFRNEVGKGKEGEGEGGRERGGVETRRAGSLVRYKT